MRGELYAGVMSGTSLDGVDAVVADFAPASGRACERLGRAQVRFDAQLRERLSALQTSSSDEVARAADAARDLADRYAEAILAACVDARVDPAELVAAGVHGQTIRHRPERGWTVQINDAARVVERAGVAVVADFRRRDLAAGGQGAPLVPAFHAAAFGDPRIHRVVVNIGGIANLTDLPPGGIVRGFDTGPGNVLSDLWHARHRGGLYDEEGRWASAGTVVGALLETMLADAYFAARPPKSTGRDRFNGEWLDAAVARAAPTASLADVQATIVELTVRTIAGAIAAHAPGADEVLLCGGGALNRTMLQRLEHALAPAAVRTTAVAGVDPQDVEALAFAWLARETIAGRPGNRPEVTGASGPRVLGAVYPR
ncbi:MAG: anhydro-N-acetylmuramic acid kinase [Burkholderiales bacterium]